MQGLLQLIEAERRSDTVNRLLLQHLLRMLTALGIYEDAFQVRAARHPVPLKSCANTGDQPIVQMVELALSPVLKATRSWLLILPAEGVTCILLLHSVSVDDCSDVKLCNKQHCVRDNPPTPCGSHRACFCSERQSSMPRRARGSCRRRMLRSTSSTAR